MDYGLEVENWCESCRRVKLHRSHHERLTGPVAFLSFRFYSLKCGIGPEVAFK